MLLALPCGTTPAKRLRKLLVCFFIGLCFHPQKLFVIRFQDFDGRYSTRGISSRIIVCVAQFEERFVCHQAVECQVAVDNNCRCVRFHLLYLRQRFAFGRLWNSSNQTRFERIYLRRDWDQGVGDIVAVLALAGRAGSAEAGENKRGLFLRNRTRESNCYLKGYEEEI
jgi:hypothetical protein